MPTQAYQSTHTGAQIDAAIDAVANKADKIYTVSTVAYDTTNHKITKTINGTTTDVVTAATIVQDGGGATITFRQW